MADLPEPYDYCYEWHGPWGTRKFSAASHNGRRPDKSVPLFTADQLRTYAAAQVAEAVAEERERLCAAIKAADDKSVDEADYMLTSNDCISVIRGTWAGFEHVDAIRATEAHNPQPPGASPVETLAAPAARSET